jgi:hypothetical protein
MAVSGWCGSASAVGYLLHGPVAASVALAAVVLAVCAVAVLRPVLLGDSDPRSPFVRFMLLVCVLIGRPPGDYLPPSPLSPDPSGGPDRPRSATGGASGGTGAPGTGVSSTGEAMATWPPQST